MKIPVFRLERFFARYEFEAPYLLCASDCETMSIGELPDLAEVSPGDFDWGPPKAGPAAFPAVKTKTSIDAFCQNLVKKAGVLLAPGTLYGESFDRRFRIGFGRKNLGECVRKPETYLEGDR